RAEIVVVGGELVVRKGIIIPAVDNHGVDIISIRVVDYQVVRLNSNRGSLRDFDTGIHLVGDHRDVVSTDYRELVAELFTVIGTIIDVKVYCERSGIIVIGGEMDVRVCIIIRVVDYYGEDFIRIRVVDSQVIQLDSIYSHTLHDGHMVSGIHLVGDHREVVDGVDVDQVRKFVRFAVVDVTNGYRYGNLAVQIRIRQNDGVVYIYNSVVGSFLDV